MQKFIRILDWIDRKLIRLRDWLWPRNWPKEITNTLTGFVVIICIMTALVILISNL